MCVHQSRMQGTYRVAVGILGLLKCKYMSGKLRNDVQAALEPRNKADNNNKLVHYVVLTA